MYLLQLVAQVTFYLYFDLALGHWYLWHIDKGRWWQRNDSATEFRLCLNAPCLQLLLHSILTKISRQSLCYFCRSKCLACIQKCKMEISRQPSISFAPFVCKINQPCCYQLIHPLCIMLRGFLWCDFEQFRTCGQRERSPHWLSAGLL